MGWNGVEETASRKRLGAIARWIPNCESKERTGIGQREFSSKDREHNRLPLKCTYVS